MAKKKSGGYKAIPAIPQLDLFADTPKFHTMVLLDREPILKEWRAQYRALEKELADLSKKTEEFQFEAVPAFQAWVARSFGEELSAIRETEEKIRENELVLLATLEESRNNDCSEAEAYRVILLRKEHGEDLFAPADDWEEGWSEVDPETNYHLEDERAPDPDELSREFFRKQKREEANAAALDSAARLKLLYRKLAFALHPDANPNQTARERKIWDEVQIAYADRNLERLEMLHAWIESGSEGWLDRMTHLGTLRALVIAKIAEVRSSHQSFNRLKREDSWKFWLAKGSEEKLDLLRINFEEDILRDLLILQRRLREFELQFHRWRNDGARTPKKKKSRPARGGSGL
jgi:hypothetical protein